MYNITKCDREQKEKKNLCTKKKQKRKILCIKEDTMWFESDLLLHTHQLRASVLQTEVLIAQFSSVNLPSLQPQQLQATARNQRVIIFLCRPEPQRLIKDDLFHFSEK